MKKLFFLCLASISILLKAQSQVPPGINYQGMIRNTSGVPATNSVVVIEFELFNQYPAVGVVPAYKQKHTLTTSNIGMVTCTIGIGGSVLSGSFSAVTWSGGDVWYKVFADVGGSGTSVQIGDAQKFMTVPYAFYSKAAAFSWIADSARKAPSPALSINGYILSVGSSTNTITLPTGTTYTAGNGIAINSGIITNTVPTVTISGTGVSGSYPSYTIAPTAQTTINQGSNITVSGSAPSYTVSAPSYSISFTANSLKINNGVSSSTTIVAPTLSLSGSILASGTSTNAVNLSSLSGLWTQSGALLSPQSSTNSVIIGVLSTTATTNDKVEIVHNSIAPSTPSLTSAHLHLKQFGTDLFSRIKFSNTSNPNKFWINSVTTDANDANSGYNIFYHNGGANGHNIFTVGGDGQVYVNPFNTLTNAILNVNGKLRVDSTLTMAAYNTAPALSSSTEGRIYFDRTTNKFKVSENAGAYVNLVNSPVWGYNTGVIYPINNASTDKVAIGSSFANALLDIQNTVSTTITALPVVSIQNFNPTYSNSGGGILTVKNSVGSGNLMYLEGNTTFGNGLAINMLNTSGSDNAINAVQKGFGNNVFFEIQNPSNYANSLVAKTNGSGAAIYGQSTGAGHSIYGVKSNALGNAGKFEIQSTLNASDALYAQTVGTGAAIHAVSGANSNVALQVEDGHISSLSSGSLAISIGCSSCVTSALNLDNHSTDVAGTINVNYTTVPSGNADINVTFAKSYKKYPVIIITPSKYPSGISGVQYLASPIGGPGNYTGFKLSMLSGVSISGTYSFNYMIIEGKQ